MVVAVARVDVARVFAAGVVVVDFVENADFFSSVRLWIRNDREIPIDNGYSRGATGRGLEIPRVSLELGERTMTTWYSRFRLWWWLSK